MKEIWKQIDIFEGEFYVSNFGRVKNISTGNIIKGDVNNFGYHRVTMWNKGQKYRKFRHRLVAEYFIPNPENKRFVNHKNGDKKDNKVSNLEWVTQSENEKHAFKYGLKQKTNKPFEVEFKCGKIIKFDTQKQAGKFFNVSTSTIGGWIKNKNKGFKSKNISKIYFIKA